MDSNCFGPVSLGLVTKVAKATCIVWPPSRRQYLTSTVPENRIRINLAESTLVSMRAVRFVKRLEWKLPSTVFRDGLTIGDVDNDGDNELVVGTAEGDVCILTVIISL